MLTKLLSVLISSLATAASLRATENTLIPCGGTFENINATFAPSAPLTINEETYLYLSCDIPNTIVDGYIITSITLNGIPYADMKSNLCGNTLTTYYNTTSRDIPFPTYRSYEKFVGLACPIERGQYIQNSSFIVPNIEGKLKMKIQWFSYTSTLLLCLKAFVDIVNPHDEL
jgi:hypothetical protein